MYKKLLLFTALFSLSCAGGKKKPLIIVAGRQTPTAIWNNHELRFDWNTINLSDTNFWQNLVKKMPAGMCIGTATSAQQIEGARTHNGFATSNWTESVKWGSYYRKHIGPDHWNNYEADAKLHTAIGANAHRMSIAWEKIQPNGPNSFDQAAMNHYIADIKAQKAAGIAVWICLFHFTEPVWFTEAGGFLNADNIQHFVRFGDYVMQQLDGLVTHWASFNEPVAYACETYLTGKFPPHYESGLWNSCVWLWDRVVGFRNAGIATRNMMHAHAALYECAKAINQHNQFGLIHVFTPLEPYNSNSSVEQFIAARMSHMINESILDIFKTGHFNWLGIVKECMTKQQHTLDWIGVNYYTHEYIRIAPFSFIFGQVKAKKGEPTTDALKAIYAEGLYRAIALASTVNKPMYVTEIGVPVGPKTDRNEWFKKHIYAIAKAYEDGYPVKGIFFWTLMDSLGWKERKESKYGLFAVDFNGNSYARDLRYDSKPLVEEFIKPYMKKI
ncbi:MAG: family 1 glycosylhydrolase [Candidatus Babeliales bacterium]